MRTIRLIAAEKEAAQEMSDENRTAAECAEIRANVLRQLQTVCRAKGLGQVERIVSAFYQGNQQGDTWIWAVFRLADGSQGTAKINGAKEACILIEEAFAEEEVGQ